MTDIKDLLQLAVEDEPMTAFDIDRTITSGRRRLWRRRFAVVGAAVLSVATVAAIVVGLDVQSQRHSQPATSETPGPPGSERAAQLTGIVARVLVLPPGMRQVPDGPWPTSFQPMHSRSKWDYRQHLDLVDALGSGSLDINVTTDGSFPDCTASSTPGLTCTHRVGPDGADLTVYHQTGAGGWSGTAVLRRLPDGTWASAWTSSLSWTLVRQGWSYTSVGWEEIPADVKPTRPSPPLPVERLIDLVTALSG